MSDLFEPTNFSRRNRVDSPVSKKTRTIPKKEFRETLDQVTLSRASKNQESNKSKNPSSAEVRQDLVKKFQQDLAKGSYQVRSEEIADKIVQKIREEKDRVIL